LAKTPERARLEFERLSLGSVLRPVFDEGPRPFLRAEGSGRFEDLAFAQHSVLPVGVPTRRNKYDEAASNGVTTNRR